jgi:hypothetical protein
MLVEQIKFKESDILKQVSDDLKNSIELYDTSSIKFHTVGANKLSNTLYPHVIIHLKNGLTIGRNLIVFSSSPSSNTYYDTLKQQSQSYKDAKVVLPPDKEIAKIICSFYSVFTAAESDALWKSFKREYSSLSYVDKVSLGVNNKLIFKGGSDFSKMLPQQYMDVGYITAVGVSGNKSYYSTYIIDEKTPETLKLLAYK